MISSSALCSDPGGNRRSRPEHQVSPQGVFEQAPPGFPGALVCQSIKAFIDKLKIQDHHGPGDQERAVRDGSKKGVFAQ